MTRLNAILAAILIAALLRLLPHPPNFTPIGAMALFAGAHLGRRWLAFAAPLAALLVSDLLLGFHSTMVYVYAATAGAVLIGSVLGARPSAVGVGLASVSSAVLFFAVTNFGVWLSGGLYPRDLGGLAACFVAAIPFFQYSLAGDLVFSALLFGGFALAERQVPALRPA